MTTQYNGDALWSPCPDGGDIEFVGGAVTRSGGLPGAVYILLFGGNHEDPGGAQPKFQWWGNILETDPALAIRSRTGTLIAGIPMSTGNLQRVEQAASLDLAVLISQGVATAVAVSAAIEAAKRLKLTVEVDTDNGSFTFIYRENWLIRV